MDPDTNLDMQVALAQQIVDGQMGKDFTVADVDRLAELVLALDGWIANGGFLPAKWRKA